ncbi:MAG: hypothetical protein ABJK39_08775 [Hyphomicrobiales bacterium]
MINKKILKLSGFAVCALWLAGCQVQPLHSTAALSDGSAISSALASINVAEPKTRLDQLVRNELLFSLSGGTSPTGDLPFELTMRTNKKVRSVGISDVDFGPRAFFVDISTDYVLKDRRKAAPIAQGTEQGTASYDRVDQEFTNVRSERDAEIRAAKATALRLRQALAIALQRAR